VQMPGEMTGQMPAENEGQKSAIAHLCFYCELGIRVLGGITVIRGTKTVYVEAFLDRLRAWRWKDTKNYSAVHSAQERRQSAV
jgi:hypothetical protein